MALASTMFSQELDALRQPCDRSKEHCQAASLKEGYKWIGVRNGAGMLRMGRLVSPFIMRRGTVMHPSRYSGSSVKLARPSIVRPTAVATSHCRHRLLTGCHCRSLLSCLSCCLIVWLLQHCSSTPNVGSWQGHSVKEASS